MAFTTHHSPFTMSSNQQQIVYVRKGNAGPPPARDQLALQVDPAMKIGRSVGRLGHMGKTVGAACWAASGGDPDLNAQFVDATIRVGTQVWTKAVNDGNQRAQAAKPLTEVDELLKVFRSIKGSRTVTYE